jgi:hypothetical protein
MNNKRSVKGGGNGNITGRSEMNERIHRAQMTLDRLIRRFERDPAGIMIRLEMINDEFTYEYIVDFLENINTYENVNSRNVGICERAFAFVENTLNDLPTNEPIDAEPISSESESDSDSSENNDLGIDVYLENDPYTDDTTGGSIKQSKWKVYTYY